MRTTALEIRHFREMYSHAVETFWRSTQYASTAHKYVHTREKDKIWIALMAFAVVIKQEISFAPSLIYVHVPRHLNQRQVIHSGEISAFKATNVCTCELVRIINK